MRIRIKVILEFRAGPNNSIFVESLKRETQIVLKKFARAIFYGGLKEALMINPVSFISYFDGERKRLNYAVVNFLIGDNILELLLKK